MRIFAAIFPPESWQGHLAEFLSQSRPLNGLKWVPPASVHITLKFLGSVEESKISVITNALSHVAARHSRFELGYEGGGVFPSRKRPSVFWTGLAGGVDHVRALAMDAETAMAGIGFPRESREFKPHLTLARSRAGRFPRDLGDQFCTLFSTYRSPMFNVDTIHLVQSHLGSSGSRYERIASFSLGPSE